MGYLACKFLVSVAVGWVIGHILYHITIGYDCLPSLYKCNTSWARHHPPEHCDVITLLYDVLCFSHDSIVVALATDCDVMKAHSIFLALTHEILKKF